MNREKTALLTIGVITLVAVTAGASAFVTKNSIEQKEARTDAAVKTTAPQKITWNEPRQNAQPVQNAQPQQPACDDGNIVGAAVGAVAGGVVGNQFGSGKGQDLATIGGAIGGGWLGKDHIPTRNVLCP